jgi:hypothetical protein
MRHLPSLYVAVLLFSLASNSFASDVILLAPEGDYARKVTRLLTEKIPGLVVSNHADRPSDTNETKTLYLALGDKIYKSKDMPTGSEKSSSLIGVFTTPFNDLRKNTVRVNSIPSPEVVANTIAKAFPKKRVGYIAGAVDENYLKELRSSLGARAEIVIEINEGDIFKSVRNLIDKKIDAILITQNSNVYPAVSIRTLLEICFRKRIPVMSTNKRLVEAGAVISISAKEESVVDLTAETTRKISLGLPVNEENYPEEWEITVNSSMLELYGMRGFRNE